MDDEQRKKRDKAICLDILKRGLQKPLKSLVFRGQAGDWKKRDDHEFKALSKKQ